MVSMVLIFAGVLGLFFIATVIGIIIYRSSYKNHAFVARQTGSDINNVIWMKDKFRVRFKDGYWYLQFRKLRANTSNVDGKNWTTLSKNNRVIRLDKSEWESKDMSNKIHRGLFFYETSHGELIPMSIGADGNGTPRFSVLSTDNKRWLAQEIKDINSLTRNRTREMLMIVAAIVACLVLGVIFIFGIIYLNEQANNPGCVSKAQASCTAYIDKLMNLSDTIRKEYSSSIVNTAANRPGG